MSSNDLLILEDATDGTVYKVSAQKILDAGGFADIGLITNREIYGKYI